MTAGAWMPKISTTPIYLGNYAENTYPNPIKSATSTVPAGITIAGFTYNPLTFAEEADPSKRI
jgi:hypothetical protein